MTAFRAAVLAFGLTFAAAPAFAGGLGDTFDKAAQGVKKGARKVKEGVERGAREGKDAAKKGARKAKDGVDRAVDR